jgi:hypothetical protein
MENTENKQKPSRPVSFLLLIPSLLFGLIALALSVVGLGLIPIVPAVIGIILGGISFYAFKNNYRFFTRLVLGISILAFAISVFRGTVIKGRVAVDKNFDSTVVKTQEGVESDLNDAFSDDDKGTSEKKDSTAN